MSGRLEGQVAVVTGAGRGLGAAYALALAKEGASVVVNDLGGDLQGVGESSAPANDVVREIKRAGGQAVANYGDVSDFDDAGKIIETAVSTFGKLDVIITNAGMDRRGALYELTADDWDATLKVHVYGSFNCSWHAANRMREQRSGAIINVTSAAFYMGVPRLGAYTASKGAIYGMMRTLCQELQPFGVSVNCIVPGLTRTRAVNAWLGSLRETPETPEGMVEAMEASLQEPEAVAPLAVFLASEEGRKITGQAFEIEGARVSVLAPPSPNHSAFSPTGTWTPDDLANAIPRLMAQA